MSGDNKSSDLESTYIHIKFPSVWIILKGMIVPPIPLEFYNVLFLGDLVLLVFFSSSSRARFRDSSF